MIQIQSLSTEDFKEPTQISRTITVDIYQRLMEISPMREQKFMLERNNLPQHHILKSQLVTLSISLDNHTILILPIVKPPTVQDGDSLQTMKRDIEMMLLDSLLEIDGILRMRDLLERTFGPPHVLNPTPTVVGASMSRHLTGPMAM